VREVGGAKNSNSTWYRAKWIVLVTGPIIAVAVVAVVSFHKQKKELILPGGGDPTPVTYTARPISYPNLSKAGEFMVFSNPEAGKWDIYHQLTATGVPENLTEKIPANCSEPDLSPDNQDIAFACESESPKFNGIFVMGVGGGNVTQEAPFGHNPSWSRDGKHIVFATSHAPDRIHRSKAIASSLYDVDIVGHKTTFLYAGNAIQPHWSPDGASIVFCSMLATGSSVWVFDMRNRHAHPLTDDKSINWFPAWSRNGETIYFLSNRSGRMTVWRIAATGDIIIPAREVSVPESQDINCFAITSDGRMLYGAEFGSLNIYKTAGLGSPRERVVEASGFRSPTVSPDGLTLVAVSAMSTSENLFLFDGSGGPGEPLTHFKVGTHVGTPRWSPTQEYITFYSDADGPLRIWLLKLSDRSLKSVNGLPDGSLYPVLSPDMTRIAITRPGESSSIAVVDAQGMSARIERGLPSLPNGLTFTAWSWSKNSSKLLGFAQSRNGTPKGIYIYDILLNHYEMLTTTGVYPILRDDQNTVVFQDAGQLYETNVQTGVRRVILSMAPDRIAGGFDLSKTGGLYINVFHSAVLLFLGEQLAPDLVSQTNLAPIQ